MKKIFIILLFIFLLGGCTSKENESNLILASNFPAYDFAKQIVGETNNFKVEMLLPPGSEMHDFEPTPRDLKKIGESKLFIYVGGESDSWLDNFSVDLENVPKIKMMDLVSLTLEGEALESEEEDEDEYDEHVWTSIRASMEIVNAIALKIANLDPDNRDIYLENANNYIAEMTEIDNQIKEIVESSKRKELIFGDRFPLIYFVKDYDLTYYAAFPGCSEQTEASSRTISFLVDKVKENKIPVIFKIELSKGNIASVISEETGAKVLEFNTMHNISASDFQSGATYTSIMRKNVEALKEGLN